MAFANFNDWVLLQRTLKQNKLRLEQGEVYAEEQDLQQLHNKFSALHRDHAKRQLQLRELVCKVSATQTGLPKVLVEQTVLGSHSAEVSSFVCYLKAHPDVLSILAAMTQANASWHDLLAETYIFSFFEDLLRPEASQTELLLLFQKLVKVECSRNPRLSDVFDENASTLLGKLLTLYTKRPTQHKFLVETFREPLLKIVYGDQRDLRVDMQSLYRKVVFSRNTLASLPTPRNKKRPTLLTLRGESMEIDVSVCLNDSEVMIGVIQLNELLIDRCVMLLTALYSKVDALPYAVRWICKVFSEALAETSDNSEADRSTLLGTLLFSKWWLPAFISADANGLLEDCEVPRVIRRNLSLVSNVRQRQVLKQVYRNSSFDGPQYDNLNLFIQAEVSKMREYFAKVVAVPDHVSSPQQAADPLLQTALISISEVKGLVELVINCEAALISQGHEELVQLAAAIKTAQQLDDLFASGKASQEQYLLVEHSDLKPKSLSSRGSDKHLNTVKEVVYELLIDLDHLGAFYSKGQECSLLDFVQFIIQHPYLFEAKKGGKMSILTYAEFLRWNLSLLPSCYKTDNFVKLYSELKEQQTELYRHHMANTDLNKRTLLYGSGVLEGCSKEVEAECRVLEHYVQTRQLVELVGSLSVPVCILYERSARRSKVRVARQTDCLHLNPEGTGSFAPHKSFARTPKASFARSPKASFKPEEPKLGHVSTIDQFVEEFLRLDPVSQSTESLQDNERISQAFFKYIAILREEVTRLAVKSPEETDRLMDAVENYILRKVFSEAFPSWASHDDISLYHKTLELDWLEPEHLDIPRGDLSMWQGPLNALSHIDHCMTPVEKLGCLVEFITRTVDLLFLYSFKEVVSADDSLPVIIYLLVKAQPLRIHSNINFISKFRHQRKLLADSGFCLSQIQSAIAFIAQVDSSSLTISAEEFEREVSEARRRHHIDR
jgi:hypothetical protein